MERVYIPIEQQVVSREVAEKLNKKLDSAGVIIWSIYSFLKRPKRDWVVTTNHQISYDGLSKYNPVPTYTLTEMLEMLPSYVKFDRCILLSCDLMIYDKCDRRCQPEIKMSRHDGNIGYVCYNNRFQWNEAFFSDTKDPLSPASAAAKLMIWLIDNGHYPTEIV